jgi:hypothetical protein
MAMRDRKDVAEGGRYAVESRLSSRGFDIQMEAEVFSACNPLEI